MKCYVCDEETWSIDTKLIRCRTCQEYIASDLFKKMETILIKMHTTNKDFDDIKEKCLKFNAVVKYYPLYLSPLAHFDIEAHEKDRIALNYLRNYVIEEDNHILQTYLPVKMEPSDNNSIYKTLALLCRLDIENGSTELRVRNVIDMVINADVYHSADPDLHSCLQWGDTWRYFVLEQLQDKKEGKGPNAILTLSLASLANILNVKIRSLYPKIPGGSDDLRKRLNHLFVPLDLATEESAISILTILWSNTKDISSHSTSTMWMPNCVAPLLRKPTSDLSDLFLPANVKSAELQNPASRSFYQLSCFCRVTQSVLDEIVSHQDQIKHSEAAIQKGDTRVPEFQCPKCSKKCTDYHYDWQAVNLFRQNFTGARFTYILIDVTSSMKVNISQKLSSDKSSSISRIVQTKEAVKQLLREISACATPMDQTILTTFDDKLRKPALIPQCRSLDVADQTNLDRIDAIQLSSISVKTHFFSVLKEVYEMFEDKPFLYIDLYIFSDGIDTSPKKNDRTYQALIRGLNEKIGAKCHFINSSSPSKGFLVSGWLGDPEADSPISGNIEEIQLQMSAAYRKDHVRTIDLNKNDVRFRGRTLNVPTTTATTYMSDKEAASIRKPRSRTTLTENNPSLNSSLSGSNPDIPKNIDDYFNTLHSTHRSRSATDSEPRSKPTELFRIVTRNLYAQRLIQNKT